MRSMASDTAMTTGRRGGLADAGPHAAVRIWLGGVALLVFAMIVVGGATRLTDSGLSITEWQPILGAIPPLTEAHWLEAFEKYKQIPEYHLVNKGMSLDAFKSIYWWEWAHRFLGRLIGFAFALPLIVFWWRGRMPRGLVPKLVGVLALGGLQGAIGWYMVSSGLTERVDVSHYRLALHLTTAFVILGLIVWLALDLAPRRAGIRLGTLTIWHRRAAIAIVALVLLQVVLGAFVAGLKAGLTYNTWPLMDGKLIPSGLMIQSPWYMNVFENITTVQFDHRLVAYVIAGLVSWHAVSVARADDEAATATALLLVAAIFAQMGLGIWTLIAAEGAIPIGLGLAHQGGAAIVLVLAVFHLHRVWSSPARA
ncbi:MAG: COX15/CtaA family protein [Hyphomicrobiaceae bacterium]